MKLKLKSIRTKHSNATHRKRYQFSFVSFPYSIVEHSTKLQNIFSSFCVVIFCTGSTPLPTQPKKKEKKYIQQQSFFLFLLVVLCRGLASSVFFFCFFFFFFKFFFSRVVFFLLCMNAYHITLQQYLQPKTDWIYQK